MIPTPQEFPKAFAVWFKELERWDPASFHMIQWHWPKEVMLPLGKCLKVRKEKVDRSQIAFSELQPITIHFDGSIDRRKIDGAREYTMDLYSAKPRDIVVAKIDLKNGAVGIIPDNWHNVAVTGHFAVYEPDRSRLLPEYLHRIIQTSFFKAHLWRNKVGAEGRKEVKLDYFESLQIPIPPLPIQQAIVDRWQKAQDEIRAANQRVEEIKQSLSIRLLRKLGISLPPVTPRKGAFTFEWKDLERWDTFFYRVDFTELEEHLLSMRHARLGELLNFTSRPWKASDFPEETFEYVEISSVTKDDGIIGSRPVNIKEAPSRATTLIKEGDLIISTTRPYLGAFAIVPNKYNNCVCSSGFSLADTIKIPDIEKEFLLLFLKSPAGLRQMERRMTGGLYPAIVQDELEKILVPIPPLAVQREIIKSVKEGRTESEQEREAAERKSREIKAEIEAIILGTKQI